MTAPRKRFDLEFRLHSHSIREMAAEMADFSTQLALGEVGAGKGGSSAGFSYRLTEDPNQSHDEYYRELVRYLKDAE